MLGKVITSNYGKNQIKGEDGRYYNIGTKFGSLTVNDAVEFEPSTSEWKGKTQYWANPTDTPGVATPTTTTVPDEHRVVDPTVQAVSAPLLEALYLEIGRLLGKNK